jgi:general stress protein 26
MHTAQELEQKFWKSLKNDRTIVLGLDGPEGGHTRPMTAQTEGIRGPIWFFTSMDGELIRQLGTGPRAFGAFSSKDHELLANMHGQLRLDNNRTAIDHFWNPFVAAWYEGGKDDPKLALLRFDAAHAEIWLNASSLLAGVKILMGGDPKKDYKDKVAHIDLH